MQDTAVASTPSDKASTLNLLDDSEEWQAFSKPAAGQDKSIWESSLSFQGMHCAACANSIERALRKLPGVQEIEVNASSQRGRLVWDSRVSKPSDWFKAVEKAGYQALPARDAFMRERRRKANRQMLWRLGVAGLCMMQVMMYASPEYFPLANDMDADSRYLLRWASWLLSIPVLLFSCQPFFASAWSDLRNRRIGMDFTIALGMLITFVVSSMGTFEPQGLFGKEVYFDSFTMFAFFLLTGRWLEQRMRERTMGSLEALMNRLPESVERQTQGGGFERVATRRVVVNDVLRIHAGEAIPADGELLSAHAQVDEALLTGESKAVAKATGDSLLTGCHNQGQEFTMLVTGIGENTRFEQMTRLMQQAASEKPDMVRVMDQWATPFLWLVLFAALGAAVYGWQQSPEHAIMAAVAVLLVTCPCALSLAAPAALLTSTGALARRGVLLQHMQALQALAEVDTFVFDKTGTLTEDGLQLNHIFTRAGCSQAQALAIAAGLAAHSLHPIARCLQITALPPHAALVAQATTLSNPVANAAPIAQFQEVQEIAGAGLQTPEYRLGSAAFCQVPALTDGGVQTHLVELQQGHTIWLASFSFTERLRRDAPTLFAQLPKMDKYLLTGDSAAAANSVGRLLGLDAAHIHAEAKPEDKLQFMQNLQAAGKKVAMVGDGLNDGPVLAAAHVSFAIGRAVPLTKAQADFLLMGENLQDISVSWRQSVQTMRVIRENLLWAVLYNLIMVPLAAMGLINAWLASLGMAISSLLVVANALRLSKIQHTNK